MSFGTEVFTIGGVADGPFGELTETFELRKVFQPHDSANDIIVNP